MPPTIISTDYTGVGPVHTFAGSDGALEIAVGTTIVTTDPVFRWDGGANNIATIYGSVTSGGQVTVVGAGSSLNIGAGAEFILTYFAVGVSGIQVHTGASIFNHGTISAVNTGGISLYQSASAQNSGSLSGMWGLIFVYDSSGAAASNSGTITATGAARGKDPVYSAGVVLAGKDGIFYNLAGGVVRAQNDFGAGVNVFNSGGNLVQNHGSIISDNFYGVDLGSVALGETGNRLVNRGEITGGNGTSYNGSQNADHILNRGDLNGDVVMGNGDDTIDNRAGTITGDWYGGEGDDYFLGHLGATVTGTIYGGGGSDTLLGGDNADLISGDEGRDLIQGGGGDDLIYGGAGGDTLAGQDGRDYVSGGEGADLMSGGAGNDALSGGEGRDTIYGGDGDDVIQGGTGGDLLYGGAGADTFYFSDASESPVDVAGRAWIMDFKAGEDFINLSAIDADTLTDGRQVFTFIGNTAFSGTAGELRYDRATWLVTGDTDGDGLADFSIVLAHGPTGITATDFILG